MAEVEGAQVYKDVYEVPAFIEKMTKSPTDRTIP
jgi:hypothetical protein